MRRRLVVFDLDETLVHATQDSKDREPDFMFEDHSVFIRPHFDSAIAAIASVFDMAVWSSATSRYVDVVVSHLFSEKYPLQFAWSVDRCVQRVDQISNGYVYVKDLRKVRRHGYSVEQILMVDDSPEKLIRQPRSHIPIKPFTGDETDAELRELPAVLMSAAGISRL